jgi:hypothetical protein
VCEGMTKQIIGYNNIFFLIPPPCHTIFASLLGVHTKPHCLCCFHSSFPITKDVVYVLTSEMH